MKTYEEKKQFALAQIKPYIKDESLIARDANGNCQYYTTDGKMCVAGKNLDDPIKFKGTTKCIESLMQDEGQDILKPESRDILTAREWGLMQNIHDNLDNRELMTTQKLESICRELDLFTYDELMSL